MSRRVLTLLAVLASFAALGGQSVKVDASLNRTTVFKSDPVIYTIAVTTSYRIRVQEPDTPAVKGLRFSHVSTSTRTNTTYRNFKASSEYVQEFRYQYYPVSTGKFTFPSQAVAVDGIKYSTPSMVVEVKPDPKTALPGTTPPSPGSRWNPWDQYDPWEPDTTPREEGKTFILALPETQTVFRGQPALVSYYIYTNQDVRSYGNESVVDQDGYGKEIYNSATMLQFDRAAYGGQNYQRALLKTYAIFPQRVGVLKVPKLSATVRWNYHSFFEQAVDSAPASISVRELPAGAPSTFMGALGRFEVGGSLSRNTARAGEAVTYTLRIKGLGNFNQFSAPAFPRSSDLQISAPLARDQIKGGCDGTRDLVYTVIPRRSGSITLPTLIFSWLDTESGKYLTYASAPVRINVSQSGAASGGSGGGGSNGSGTMHSLILREDYPHYRPLYARWWYWMLALGLLASLAGSALMAKRRVAMQSDPLGQALRAADKDFELARAETAALARKGSREFYSMAEKGLLAYVARMCQLPSHLPTGDIISTSVAQGFPADCAEELKDFLADCQMQRFAPQEASAQDLERDLGRYTALANKLHGLRARAPFSRPGGAP